MGTLFSVKPRAEDGNAALPAGLAVFELCNSLLFGAVGKVEALPDTLAPGTHTVVLDMQRLVLMDSSGLDALEQMHRALQGQGTALCLAQVNEQPPGLMRWA
jgi:SulP family sulfate permease